MWNVIFGVAFISLATWLIYEKWADARRVIDEPYGPARRRCGCPTTAPVAYCSNCNYITCQQHYSHRCAAGFDQAATEACALTGQPEQVSPPIRPATPTRRRSKVHRKSTLTAAEQAAWEEIARNFP